jgi:protein-disulfide isomerase
MRKTAPERRPVVRVSSGDQIQGSTAYAVTLIGYGDYSSPDSRKTYRMVRAVQKKMGARLRYIFRCFPESKASEHAAEAAECAATQGKFWKMHDRLLERKNGSGAPSLIACARDAGLDLTEFRRCMREHRHLAKIRARRSAGVRRGVSHPPTFFVNSVRHESAFGHKTLLPAIQAAAGDA